MKIDIIIPIYNAFDFVEKCIETVIENSDLTNHTLWLINDKSSDERIAPLLESVATAHPDKQIVVINSENNHGFVQTVNIGMKRSQHDVILLNSDTEVTPRWLEKLQTCAYSKSRVATVTPLSNNATLASIPVFMEENVLPEGFSVDEYAALVEQNSLHLYPEIPTAHGFCMYIKREAIEEIGLFDEVTFEKGYGEENDFSYRCLQAGYRHLLCDDTYIYHKGSQSFSTEKIALIQSHLQILKKKHPLCVAQTESFVEQNPFRSIQENMRYAAGLHGRKNILIVIHDFKDAQEKGIGGTTLHVHDLIQPLRAQFNFHVLYYAEADYQYHLTSYLTHETIQQSLGRCTTYAPLGLYCDDFKTKVEQIITALRIDLIHIHHLKQMYLDVFAVAQSKQIPVVYTLHDFYSVCPSIKLKNDQQWICDYTQTTACAHCSHYPTAATRNFITTWRKEFHQALRTATRLIVPSQSTAQLLQQAYDDVHFEVVPHGYNRVEELETNPTAPGKGVWDIAFVGYITPEKGLHYLQALIETEHPSFRIHLFGETSDKKLNKSRKNYICHGAYNQKELPHLLAQHHIHLVCLFSIWAETYSYTLSESLIAQIPVITFDLGAMAERVKAIDAGWILPMYSTVQQIIQQIEEIQADTTNCYLQKVKNIQAHLQQMKSVQDMGRDYEKTYTDLIEKSPVTHCSEKEVVTRWKFLKDVLESTASKGSRLEEAREYKRLKRIIKSDRSKEQIQKELDEFRRHYPHSKYQRKLSLKYIWYKLLR